MDIMTLRTIANKCSREDPAFCSTVCPLNIDVRVFIDKLRKGSFMSAYKHLKSTVYFPKTVCRICDAPCEMECALCGVGKGIAVRALERACCEYGAKGKSDNYYIRPKDEKIAVVGAGLAGLACAARLAKTGYSVDLYEKNALAGGWLTTTDDAELRETAAAEIDALLAECSYLTFHPNTEITELSSLEADAIYVATTETRFGLDDSRDPVTFATGMERVFLCRADASPIEALGEGIRVSDTVEAYAQIKRVVEKKIVFEKLETNLFRNTKGELVGPRIPAELASTIKPAGAVYTKDEAKAEAERCLGCTCNRCIEACPVLADYKQVPRKIIEDVNATVYTIDQYMSPPAQREINSCTMCGLCESVCPRDISFDEIFLSGRQLLHARGTMPPAYHDFWLRDMDFSLSESCYSELMHGDSCEYALFPGCQLGGSDPQYVVAAFDYLEKHLDGSVGALLGCCGAPALWAGRIDKQDAVTAQLRESWERMGRPVLVTACLYCEKVLTDSLPQATILSLYTIMAKNGIESAHTLDEPVAVFDPCASRHDASAQAGVRELLHCAGCTVEELPFTGEEAHCCGYGGQVHAANKPLLDKLTEARAADSARDYIVYCANCRETFAGKGKRAMHILDLLIDKPVDERFARPMVHYSDSRDNRERVKRIMSERFGIELKENESSAPKLYISDELLKLMDERLIIRQEAERVIATCEETGEKLLDRKTGSFVGYARFGAFTIWVTYHPEEDGFRLDSIYSHRVKLEDGTDE